MFSDCLLFLQLKLLLTTSCSLKSDICNIKMCTSLETVYLHIVALHGMDLPIIIFVGNLVVLSE